MHSRTILNFFILTVCVFIALFWIFNNLIINWYILQLLIFYIFLYKMQQQQYYFQNNFLKSLHLHSITSNFSKLSHFITIAWHNTCKLALLSFAATITQFMAYLAFLFVYIFLILQICLHYRHYINISNGVLTTTVLLLLYSFLRYFERDHFYTWLSTNKFVA